MEAGMAALFWGGDIRDRQSRMSPSRVKNAIWLIRRSQPSGEGGCGLRVHEFYGIHLRLDNPKIGRVDDAEVIGDRIAEDGPVFRHLLAQEMQNGFTEVA